MASRKISINRPKPMGGGGKTGMSFVQGIARGAAKRHTGWGTPGSISSAIKPATWGGKSVSQSLPSQPAPAATTSASQPMPYDAIYEDALARNQRDLTQAQGQLQFEQTDLDQTYSDPSNPFNRLAMAKRRFDQQKAGNLNSMAARGQLYSGALQRQQDELRFGHEAENDDLARSYQRAKQSVAARKFSAQSAFDDNKTTAGFDRIARLGA